MQTTLSEVFGTQKKFTDRMGNLMQESLLGLFSGCDSAKRCPN